ncbi:hypothetical protein JCM24511_06254 [Saitozyma sp. JCM 24511]|nr:hypothetical protein JCM24511_06254 [Saitozyma sp. JCM 24511]
MAVVLRSNSDLAYLPDHGFVGEDGAIRILLQITRQIRRLDISHNLLGPPGARSLLNGLATLRLRYSSKEYGIWGLSEVNLGCNALDDGAMDALMGYAKKDVCLRKVLVQANDIELKRNLESIINSLNSSRISTLSLTNNPNLSPSSLTRLFAALSSPHLTELHLNTCAIGPGLAPSIAAYLRSTRSRRLELLELNGNHLGLSGVREIVDAVERGNFTIKHLGLVANESLPPRPHREGGDDIVDGADEDEQSESPEPEDRRSAEEKLAEERALSYEVHERLPVLLERNRVLTRRVRRAAVRCLAPARILLNAQPIVIDDLTTARQVIEEVSSNRTHLRPQPFPLLSLPEEVLHLVIRHTSGDATALSDSQWVRLRTEAGNRESLRRAARSLESKLRRAYTIEERQGAGRELMEEWLMRGKWDRWELDRPATPAEVDSAPGPAGGEADSSP